jgi:acyl-coenzyme A thioesterase PaaI-like protein
MATYPENTPLRFPFPDGGCFGCSQTNEHGLHLTFERRGDEVHGRHRLPDRFHGAPGVAHGGIVAVLLDEYSCAAAVFLRDTRVVTGELSVRYEAPCPVESELEVRSRVVDESHPRYLVIEAEVRSEDAVVARSRGKFFPQAL